VTDVSEEFALILYILILIWVGGGEGIGTRVAYEMLLSDHKVGENWLLGE
jgi:hypothetical protein